MTQEIGFRNLATVDERLQLETLKWRNSELVAPFFQIQKISEETHRKWLKSLNDPDPKTIAFLIELNGQEVGMTYFSRIDRQNSASHWGIYLHRPEARNKGLAQKSLRFCLEYAKQELGLRSVSLEVLASNEAAVHVYTKLGFRKTGEFFNEDRLFFSMETHIS